MVLKKDKNQKLYHSINEVAQMFQVEPSTLRYWEDVFPQLKPRTTDGGTRQYRWKDIEMVRLIHHLLKEKGLTIKGAQKKLKENPDTTVKHEEIVNKLKHVKGELQAMIAAFSALEETQEKEKQL